MAAPNPDELGAQISQLLAQGQKIQAIKVYREQTGVGLAEAKDAVEAYERGGPLVMSRGIQAPLTGAQSLSMEGRVLELLQAGRKIEAIKAYRQGTGLGLKEAKDAVEELARKNGLETGGGGCLGVLLAVAALPLASWWAWF